jgi:tRNA 2-thiouridine synthesizing protein D
MSTTTTPKTLTFVLMDPPYESANLTTALRLLDIAARRGFTLHVFAYEGAAALAFMRQAPHPNPVHGKNVAEENHPTTKDQVAALLACAEASGGKVDWVSCGMCVDERGVGEHVPGTRRGSPADLHASTEASDNILVIPTK